MKGDIPMTDTEALQKVQKAIIKYLTIAVKALPELEDLPELKISTNLKGRCGGMYIYGPDYHEIKINRVLLEENEEYILGQTVPHEVSHFIVHFLYGDSRDCITGRRKIKPHGIQWKGIMNVLGKKAHRCHNMDTSNLISTTNKIKYKCGCRSHYLTHKRHIKICNTNYMCTCNICGDILVCSETNIKPKNNKIPSTSDFFKGQMVKFKGTKNRIFKGEIVKINKKTLTIYAYEDCRKWRVPTVYIIK